MILAAGELTKVTGYVDHVIYRNSENGYTVMEVSTREKTLTLVGNLFYVDEGEYIEAEGRLTAHPVYGEQLQVTSCEVKPPEDLQAIERYLASGAVSGIGAGLAGRIVKLFGTDTFRILEEEPERLAEVKGISEKKAAKIAEETYGRRQQRQAIVFLQSLGIGLNLALKIYETYKDELYSIVRQNPYRLADDIKGVGFQVADHIAVRSGIEADSDFRIRSGLLFVLNQAGLEGHTCLPDEELMIKTGQMLGLRIDNIDEFLMNLSMEKRIMVKEEDGKRNVYPNHYYYAELETAVRLHRIREVYAEYEEPSEDSEQSETITARLHAIEDELDIELEEKQREAFFKAVTSGLLVITGGPGTGKTTIIRTIIQYFEEEEERVLLAAPTGRAAKRMKEACKREARTIHRLLGINRLDEEDAGNAFFDRNEENPLEADVVIIDEMSMVDVGLMNALLKAIPDGCRLILAGDVDQLPSVGAGNVLGDIIRSECFPVVRLQKIFRQAAMSDIIVNAHKINAGERINPAAKSRDFLFIRGRNPQSVMETSMTLVRDKLPRYVHADMEDIQILTPMRKGPLGVEALNTYLQSVLNPPSENKREKEAGGVIYRVGDKVMQVKNNYRLEWEIRGRKGYVIENGTGVFNGDIGVIRSINLFSEEVEVEFEEGRMVTYSFKMLDELELAYAVTVHKSQGSEYPAVVLPLLSGPSMLFNRNLLYTAVTRAKNCVCIVGSPETFFRMIDNNRKYDRYTGLEKRIREQDPGNRGLF